MRFLGMSMIVAALSAASADAVVITDEFNYANSAAFESVYTLSSTNDGSWNASFDGSKMTVNNSTPATGAFDSFYARRPIGSVTGNFQASLDIAWDSPNEAGERARIGLHLLKGDGTGVHPTALPQNAAWTFPNDGASAGLWNDYGINAVSVLINGLEGSGGGMTAQFPWRPGPGTGVGGTAQVSIKRVGSNLTATYNDGSVVRTHTMTNTDEFTHIGIWYSHFTGFPGQFDGSATYIIDNLVVDIPPPVVPGDVDRDGDVDMADYLLIQANSFTADPFGMPYLGDVNDDEFVDFEDFHVWKSNFPGGAGAAEAAIAALHVPEPAAVVLGVWGMLYVLVGHRRRPQD